MIDSNYNKDIIIVSIYHKDSILIWSPYHIWKLCYCPLNILARLENSQNKLLHPCKKRILAKYEVHKSKESNNKIHKTSIDEYCNAFPNSDCFEILTQGRQTYQETSHNILARSNYWIENYHYWCEIGQLRILRQNPNLIVFLVPGLYQCGSLFCEYPSSIEIFNELKHHFQEWQRFINVPESFSYKDSLFIVATQGTKGSCFLMTCLLFLLFVFIFGLN